MTLLAAIILAIHPKIRADIHNINTHPSYVLTSTPLYPSPYSFQPNNNITDANVLLTIPNKGLHSPPPLCLILAPLHKLLLFFNHGTTAPCYSPSRTPLNHKNDM